MTVAGANVKILETAAQTAHAVCVDEAKMLILANRHQQAGSGNEQYAATAQVVVVAVKPAPG